MSVSSPIGVQEFIHTRFKSWEVILCDNKFLITGINSCMDLYFCHSKYGRQKLLTNSIRAMHNQDLYLPTFIVNQNLWILIYQSSLELNYTDSVHILNARWWNYTQFVTKYQATFKKVVQALD